MLSYDTMSTDPIVGDPALLLMMWSRPRHELGGEDVWVDVSQSCRSQNDLLQAISSSGLLQCDQIGRFIGFWATFQSLLHQLFCPNCPHSAAIFVKVSKTLIFLVKSFLGNFYRHLATFYWSHCLGTYLRSTRQVSVSIFAFWRRLFRQTAIIIR